MLEVNKKKLKIYDNEKCTCIHKSTNWLFEYTETRAFYFLASTKRIFVHNSLKGTGHLFVSALTCDFKLYVSDYQVLAYFTHMNGKLFAVYVSPKNIM